MKKDTKATQRTAEPALLIPVEAMGKRLGIGRVGAYELARTEGFPTIKIGRRMLISVAGLEKWVEDRVGM